MSILTLKLSFPKYLNYKLIIFHNTFTLSFFPETNQTRDNICIPTLKLSFPKYLHNKLIDFYNTFTF